MTTDHKKFFESMVYNTSNGPETSGPSRTALERNEVVADMRQSGLSEAAIYKHIADGSGVVKAERYVEDATGKITWDVTVRSGLYGDRLGTIRVDHQPPANEAKTEDGAPIERKFSHKKVAESILAETIGENVEDSSFSAYPVPYFIVNLTDSLRPRQCRKLYEKLDGQLRANGWGVTQTESRRWIVRPMYEVSFDEQAITLGFAKQDIPQVPVDDVPTEKSLSRIFGSEAEDMFKAIANAHSVADKKNILSTAKDKLKAEGVNYLKVEGGGITYVDMGDCYDTTLIYDHKETKFLVGSWGDYVEKNNERFAEFVDENGDVSLDNNAGQEPLSCHCGADGKSECDNCEDCTTDEVKEASARTRAARDYPHAYPEEHFAAHSTDAVLAAHMRSGKDKPESDKDKESASTTGTPLGQAEGGLKENSDKDCEFTPADKQLPLNKEKGKEDTVDYGATNKAPVAGKKSNYKDGFDDVDNQGELNKEKGREDETDYGATGQASGGVGEDAPETKGASLSGKPSGKLGDGPAGKDGDYGATDHVDLPDTEGKAKTTGEPVSGAADKAGTDPVYTSKVGSSDETPDPAPSKNPASPSDNIDNTADKAGFKSVKRNPLDSRAGDLTEGEEVEEDIVEAKKSKKSDDDTEPHPSTEEVSKLFVVKGDGKKKKDMVAVAKDMKEASDLVDLYIETQDDDLPVYPLTQEVKESLVKLNGEFATDEDFNSALDEAFATMNEAKKKRIIDTNESKQSEVEVLDPSDVKSHNIEKAERIEKKGQDVLILYKLSKPVETADGTKGVYELEHRWLTSADSISVPQGQDFSYWSKKDGENMLKKGLFASVNLF